MLLGFLAVVAMVAPACESEWQTSIPMVGRVEPQPLLLLTSKLLECLEAMGSPVHPSVLQEFSKITASNPDAGAALQMLLDPLCVLAIEIDSGGSVKPKALNASLALEENGWRTALVKVVNRAEIRGALRIDSPNARPIPHGPASETERRWLMVNHHVGRPMLSELSGLPLEYRIIELYASTPGSKSATLEFSVGGLKGTRSPTIKQWRFQQDTDAWEKPNDCKLSVQGGSLVVRQTGNDPYFSTPVAARGGKMRLRWWGKAEQDGVAQVFWWTDKLPSADGQRCVNVQVFKDREQQYSVDFQVEGELQGVRIDPNSGSGQTRIDWIDLEYQDGEGQDWHSLEVKCEIAPTHPVHFSVVDSDGSPCMGGFAIRDTVGRVYPAQPKRQAPDLFFQTQIYRESGETIRLPNGTYTVQCSHGPESVPETKTLVIRDAASTIDYRVNRWIDTAKLGYWSGDHHIHAAGCLHYENPTQGIFPNDMLRQTMGEDLKVGCCLNWGPCFDFQKQFFRGRPDDVSRYPYLLRYDIEVSGFGSQVSGHLNLLNLKQQIPLGGDSKNHWPTLGLNTLKWAKRQGAVTGSAHSGSGLTTFVGRTSGTDGPLDLPNFNIPAFDGIGANEFIVQVAHTVDGPNNAKVPAIDFIATMNTPRVAEWNMWYHVLNCGFSVVASGETDFPCMSGERVGIGRSYVRLPGRLDYEEWVKSLSRGESYISDGTCHLMNFQKTDRGRFSVQVASRQLDSPLQSVELVVNGVAIDRRELPADGQLRSIEFKIPESSKSSWYAVRVFPNAHSNPIPILVQDKPIRASKASAQWCLAGVEQCWMMKRDTYRPDELTEAKQAYDFARLRYRTIASECDE